MQAEYTAFYKRGAALGLMAINDQPTQLAVFIGGFMGESFALRLQEGALLYEAYGDQYELRLTETLIPSDNTWMQFKAALDKIAFPSWQTEYVDPECLDGTYWSIKIEYPDLTVKSEGSNRYPGKNGVPSSQQRGGDFERLLKAVRKLIDGRMFR